MKIDMTDPIKHCPQPDPPELVMRADGYHYRTEDEMKELTDEQIKELWENADSPVQCMRAAIAADRALNAPADHEGVLQQIASLLTVMFSGARAHVHGDDKSVSGYTIRSGALHKIVGLLSSAGYPVVIPANLPTAHETITGILLSVDDSASADRDVMRQAPEGWKLVPIEPTKAMVSAAQWEDGEVTAMAVWRQMIAEAPTPPAEQPEGPARTGWPEGMLQDDSRELSKALASKPNARAEARSAAEQQVAQEPVAWMTPGGDVTRSKVFADEQSALSFGQQRPTPLYTQPSPSLAELRAKVEALAGTAGTDLLYRRDVLAEIDKLGGKV